MISQELKDQFRREIDEYEKQALAFEAGALDRQTFKRISGGFGSYAQKDAGLMLRLRLPGGCLTKELLKFLADEVKEKSISLLKITTCQTIQAHHLSAPKGRTRRGRHGGGGVGGVWGGRGGAGVGGRV